jgi:hypothetical protein
MVLNDADIQTRIASGLLVDHDLANVKNCAYTLRAGRAFLPETGSAKTFHKSFMDVADR